VANTPKEAQARAEASFKRKEHQARDGRLATAEYEAAGQAMREKTARLKKLREAKEAADREAAARKAAERSPAKGKKKT
jgi:hypothetical protein